MEWSWRVNAKWWLKECKDRYEACKGKDETNAQGYLHKIGLNQGVHEKDNVQKHTDVVIEQHYHVDKPMKQVESEVLEPND